MFFRWRKKRTSQHMRRSRRQHRLVHLGIERLESRNLRAIMWVNEFVNTGPDDANFDVYGSNDATPGQQFRQHAGY